MRVIEFADYGGPEVLKAVDRPAPRATSGQLVVRVHAATVNPVDQWTRAGATARMTPHLTPPLVPGWDLAGEVIAVGEGVTGFTEGQPVAGMIPWFVAGYGAYAEQVAVDAGWLAPLPDGADLVAAATIPLNGQTAQQALDLLDLQSGQSLLVTGASGGVGGFAVELASRAGVRVLAVASGGDEAFVGSLGAAQVLSRGADLAGLEVDAVLDAAGLKESALSAVRDGGGFVAVSPPFLPDPERGIDLKVVGVQPNAAQLADLLAAGLTTRVAQALPLAEAAKAHRLLAEGGLRGKVVLTS